MIASKDNIYIFLKSNSSPLNLSILPKQKSWLVFLPSSAEKFRKILQWKYLSESDFSSFFLLFVISKCLTCSWVLALHVLVLVFCYHGDPSSINLVHFVQIHKRTLFFEKLDTVWLYWQTTRIRSCNVHCNLSKPEILCMWSLLLPAILLVLQPNGSILCVCVCVIGHWTVICSAFFLLLAWLHHYLIYE